MTDPFTTIKRVYNNNVVLGIESDGTEVVLLGKGIGFRRKAGEPLDATGSQRFVSSEPYKITQVADLLTDATLDEAEVARQIVTMAGDELDIPASQALLLPVLDHLSFAVRRAREGKVVDFPLRWEVAHVFPDECAVGRRAMELANARLGVTLQEDEWVAFALHLINRRWTGGDLKATVTMTDTIRGAFDLLHRRWDMPIDENSMSSARFVTHLRYLFVRALEDRQLAPSCIDVMGSVRESYPAAADAAVELGHLIGDAVGRTLTPEEVAYLGLHTARLFAEVHTDVGGPRTGP